MSKNEFEFKIPNETITRIVEIFGDGAVELLAYQFKQSIAEYVEHKISEGHNIEKMKKNIK